MSKDVSRYYDFIYLWTQITNRFGAFREVAPHTIHRGLTNPKTGEFKTETIHELIAEAARDLAPIDGLDAGCGYGGTAMELHRMLGGRWHGITINRHQIRIAQRNAARMGINGSVSFALASYDAPLLSSFNLIYGIESLVHSPDPAHTMANLAAALRTGGRLVIVDDMPLDTVPERFKDDVETFKRCWRCPILPTAGGWKQHMDAAGLTIETDRDLTGMTGPREEGEIRSALDDLQRRGHWRDRFGLSLVSDAQLGGLMLERLLRARVIEYRMLVGRKMPAP